jgi:hypothetical protein
MGLKKFMKMLVGRSQEIYLIDAGYIMDREILFSVCLLSSE